MLIFTSSTQRWCGSFIPSWLWVKAVLYSHTATRKQIKLARERNHEQQFTRRRHYIPLNHERARYNSNSSRIPELTLRRTPSPQRRISTIEPPGSPKMPKKLSLTSMPSPFLDSQHHQQGSNGSTPPRPLSAGLHPPKWDNPVTSTPLSSLEVGGALPSPVGGAPGGAGFFDGSSVRRISGSSAGALMAEHSRRRTSVVKVSRVLVIPSVARISHHSNNRSRPGSPVHYQQPHPQPHPPTAAEPT